MERKSEKKGVEKSDKKVLEKPEKKMEKKDGSDLFLKFTGPASTKEKKTENEENKSPVPKILSLRASKPAVPSAEREKKEKHGPLISPRRK